MIKIGNKQDCCGCGACVQRCPKHCILMKEDTEGFLYPEADQNICVDCGLCEKVCPLKNPADRIPVIHVYAAKNRNEQNRLASSSGGVFIALAEKTINAGGAVFGAVFDENWEVVHACAEDLKGVKRMMGSKYVQSNIGDAYFQAERILQSGRQVLFTGTPCQIAGLHRFLRRDYANLLAVDFLCHGVPSPGVWKRYLKEEFPYTAWRQTKKNSDLICSKEIHGITSINFRDKEFGWKKYSFVVHGKSAVKADKNSVLSSAIHYENAYMRGFLNDLYLRPSCYQCKCKNGLSHNDMTIGDFWGIDQIMPDFDDDMGVSLVLLYSEKGESFFKSLDLDVKDVMISDKIRQCNGGFCDVVKEHPKRTSFFEQLHRPSSTIAETVIRTLRLSIFSRIKSKIRSSIRRII